MKRTVIVSILALAIVFGSVGTAFGVTQDYTIVLPRFSGDVYTSAKTVNGNKYFSVKHMYSGNKPVRFAVCNTSRQPISSAITVYPGGATAPTTVLWKNPTSTAQSIVVRMDSATLNVVKILAQGTWVWNY